MLPEVRTYSHPSKHGYSDEDLTPTGSNPSIGRVQSLILRVVYGQLYIFINNIFLNPNRNTYRVS